MTCEVTADYGRSRSPGRPPFGRGRSSTAGTDHGREGLNSFVERHEARFVADE
jgi:hypothetical protein